MAGNPEFKDLLAGLVTISSALIVIITLVLAFAKDNLIPFIATKSSVSITETYLIWYIDSIVAFSLFFGVSAILPLCVMAFSAEPSALSPIKYTIFLLSLISVFLALWLGNTALRRRQLDLLLPFVVCRFLISMHLITFYLSTALSKTSDLNVHSYIVSISFEFLGLGLFMLVFYLIAFGVTSLMTRSSGL